MTVPFPLVLAHQVASDRPRTIVRTPTEHPEHVRELAGQLGPARLVVTEVLDAGDRIYVRWRQVGHHVRRTDGTAGTGGPLTDVGSAAYRVQDGRIVEYWTQLDRVGPDAQLRAFEADDRSA